MFKSLLLFLVCTTAIFAQDLKGKNAIITGGSRGIGEACALAFAREGANISIFVNQSVEEAEKLAKKIENEYGVDTLVCKCDVANPKEVAAAVELTSGYLGSIDILVNNAGIAQGVACEDMSYEDWQRMIDVNLTGVFLCAQAVGKKMIEEGINGSIINISSICGHIVVQPQKQCHYNAAKGGVGMLTKSLAVEWAPYGIRVNTISPGYIDTKLLAPSARLHPIWKEKTPMKRFGEASDIAEAAVFLAGPKSEFVTGADWVIDGGYICP